MSKLLSDINMEKSLLLAITPNFNLGINSCVSNSQRMADSESGVCGQRSILLMQYAPAVVQTSVTMWSQWVEFENYKMQNILSNKKNGSLTWIAKHERITQIYHPSSYFAHIQYGFREAKQKAWKLYSYMYGFRHVGYWNNKLWSSYIHNTAKLGNPVRWLIYIKSWWLYIAFSLIYEKNEVS